MVDYGWAVVKYEKWPQNMFFQKMCVDSYTSPGNPAIREGQEPTPKVKNMAYIFFQTSFVLAELETYNGTLPRGNRHHKFIHK